MCVFLVIAGIVVFIVLAVKNSNEEAKKKNRILDELVRIENKCRKDLDVKYLHDTIETKTGEKLPCEKIVCSGTIKVPYGNFPCTIHVDLADITDGNTENRYPVLSKYPDFGDENSFLSGTREVKMPHEMTGVTEMPVLVFPPETILLAKRGVRRVEVLVQITPSGSNDLLKKGKTIVELTQKGYGYTEYEERNGDINRAIARIAIAISASDGHIDKRETEVIKAYFAEQFARLKEPEKIKLQVNQAFKEVLEQHKSQSLQPKAELERSCKLLVDTGSNDHTHAAFELAVKIIAADEDVKDSEKAILKTLAELLEIPANIAKEYQDKHFEVAMFSNSTDEALLDMPLGMSNAEKIQFLNKEYQKWRGRVNHADESVRNQAELRIQAITRIRHALEESNANV